MDPPKDFVHINKITIAVSNTTLMLSPFDNDNSISLFNCVGCLTEMSKQWWLENWQTADKEHDGLFNELGVDGSACSIQKYLHKYEGICPDCYCENEPLDSEGMCIGDRNVVHGFSSCWCVAVG